MGLRLALLSTARINAKLVEGARHTEAVDIVAVGSRDRARAEAHAGEHGIPRVFDSYEAVLDDPDVDAVYIPLPNSMHVPWSIRALEAGKHVLCEKPLSRHPADVERAFDAAAAAGRVLAEAFMWRHHPQAQRLVELLPEVGTLRMIRAQFSFPEVAPGDLRLSAELEGGSLMDVGCYCVSAARLLAGEPESVTGVQVGDAVDIRFAGTLRMPGGVLAHFDCGMDIANRAELEVVGDRGSLLLADPFHARAPRIDVRPVAGEARTVEIEPLNPYTCQLEAFAATVVGSPQPFGRDDAVGQARAIEMLYAAAS